MNFFRVGLYTIFAIGVVVQILRYRILKTTVRFFVPIKVMDERERLIRLQVARTTSIYYDLVIGSLMFIAPLVFGNMRANEVFLLIFLGRALIFSASDLYFRKDEGAALTE